MADNLQVILKGLLEEPVSSASDNSATIKAKTFYKSCMKIGKKNGNNIFNKALLIFFNQKKKSKRYTISP